MNPRNLLLLAQHDTASVTSLGRHSYRFLTALSTSSRVQSSSSASVMVITLFVSLR